MFSPDATRLDMVWPWCFLSLTYDQQMKFSKISIDDLMQNPLTSPAAVLEFRRLPGTQCKPSGPHDHAT